MDFGEGPEKVSSGHEAQRKTTGHQYAKSLNFKTNQGPKTYQKVRKNETEENTKVTT